MPFSTPSIPRRRCIQSREFENWSMGLDEVEQTAWMVAWLRSRLGTHMDPCGLRWTLGTAVLTSVGLTDLDSKLSK